MPGDTWIKYHLILPNVGQRAHYLIYEELLQISKEGQNTKLDQGYEDSSQIYTHTWKYTHKRPINIFKYLIHSVSGMQIKFLRYFILCYNETFSVLSFIWSMKTLDSKEAIMLKFLNDQDQPTLKDFIYNKEVKELEHWRLREDLGRLFLKALGLPNSIPKESSKGAPISDLRSGEFRRDPQSLDAHSSHLYWVVQVATVLSAGDRAVEKAHETPPL